MLLPLDDLPLRPTLLKSGLLRLERSARLDGALALLGRPPLMPGQNLSLFPLMPTGPILSAPRWEEFTATVDEGEAAALSLALGIDGSPTFAGTLPLHLLEKNEGDGKSKTALAKILGRVTGSANRASAPTVRQRIQEDSGRVNDFAVALDGLGNIEVAEAHLRAAVAWLHLRQTSERFLGENGHVVALDLLSGLHDGEGRYANATAEGHMMGFVPKREQFALRDQLDTARKAMIQLHEARAKQIKALERAHDAAIALATYMGLEPWMHRFLLPVELLDAEGRGVTGELHALAHLRACVPPPKSPEPEQSWGDQPTSLMGEPFSGATREGHVVLLREGATAPEGSVVVPLGLTFPHEVQEAVAVLLPSGNPMGAIAAQGRDLNQAVVRLPEAAQLGEDSFVRVTGATGRVDVLEV